MAVLGLLLAGPLQSWGSESRFTTRASDNAPTKSGILGLLAAAKGLRRSDPLEDLTKLRLGVRLDQPGRHLRDFQVAISLDGRQRMPLSQRHYLADGRYVVGLEGDRGLLEGIAEALAQPAFPLYLGRRSCPPSEPLIPWLRAASLEEFLRDEPWRVADWWRERRGHLVETLEFRLDAAASTGALDEFVFGEKMVRDDAISFDPRNRQYGWRKVLHGSMPIPGGANRGENGLSHDPIEAVE